MKTRTLSRRITAFVAVMAIVLVTACDSGGSRSSGGSGSGTGTGSGTGSGSGSGSGSGTGSGAGSGPVPGGSSSGGGGTTPPPSAPPPPALLVAGWFPNWGPTGYDPLANAGSLDEMMPTWYTLQADGTLTARSWARDAQLVADCHALGIEVVPMIDDFAINGAGPVVRDAALAATLRDAILAEVDLYDLDGIDIDFEGMGEISRDAFSAFMADLGAALRSRGKVLSAAIYGKTSEPGGWSGPKSHDYAALGAAVDRFKIMMYGWNGPVAPNDYIVQVTSFAKTVVPASKIYVGVPFFGWDRVPSGTKTALTETSAEALRQSVGATATFDAAEGETTFTYVDASGVSHTVWYQDGQALASKCALTKQLGVAGIAIWRLGGELPDIWTAISAAR